jgi:biotin-(acetyl-CoA carboxylase) ligase
MEESRKQVNRTELIRNLYSRLEKWYKVLLNEDSSEIIETWREYFNFVGKHVRIEGFKNVEGICMGIDSEGALLIKERSGAIERVVAGDMGATPT